MMGGRINGFAVKLFLPTDKCLPAMKPFAQLNSFLKAGFAALLLSGVLVMPCAQASGGGEAAGPEPFKFTVNVASEGTPGGKYLQVEVVFEFAKPEAAHSIATLKPKVQHAMILVLSSENAEQLRTRPGKHKLVEKIIESVNKVIDENEKTGVKDVLFTSFIIQ